MEITIKKGLDINLKGEAAMPSDSPARIKPGLIALVPDNYPGFVPKPDVKEGDTVEIGSPLLHDKSAAEIKITSPVSGTVKSIVRGLRRKIERVEVIPDSATAARSVKFDVNTPVRELLQQSGLWVMMRQRPYDIVPAASSEPRNIFVTAFDSSPLAPSLLYAVKGKDAALAAGVKALASLTKGKVYISVPEGSAVSVPGAEIVTVKGPHPSGNPGVQIANIAPVNKGEIVWTLDVVTLAKIGTLMITGTVDPDVTIAITGSEVTTPGYAVTLPGCDIKQLLEGRTASSDAHLRIISGNVLTGIKTSMDGFLQYPYRQITVIPEGDNADEFLGWANPGAGKMSVKRSILGHFLKGRRFAPDARINGGRRAMILSGEYDSVLPMDILGEYLIKAIMVHDIDRMEQLGIYEVAPEDFALPEYVDTSKLELQKIVREGLDFMRRETE